MKRLFFLFIILIALSFTDDHTPTNAKEVAELFAQYPTFKSNLCNGCVEWDNPVYKAIADTTLGYPVCSFYVYTKEHAEMEAALKASGTGRAGILSAWHCIPSQPNVLPVYKEANKEIGRLNTPYEIALGHVQAWILCAYSPVAAIFSDVPTFNAGMEYQGQNVGTEIWTENYCRRLVEKYDSVLIWGGCTGSTGTYTAHSITVTVPAYYWKIIEYGGIYEMWLMPNLPTESQNMIAQRSTDLPTLIKLLGFDPTKVF